MAEAFIPKPGTANLFPNAKKEEEWHADFTGTLITPEDITPNTAYWFYVSNRVTAQGKPFVKVAFGNVFKSKENLTEPTKGVEVEEDSDLPF